MSNGLATEQLGENVYRIWSTAPQEPDGSIPLLWSVRYVATPGEEITDVVAAMNVNYEQRGDPLAYPDTPELLLERTRDRKLGQLRAEALRRLQELWPYLRSLDEMIPWVWAGPGLDLAKVNPRLLDVRAIAVAGFDAQDYLKDPILTQQELDAFDAVTSPSWP